MCALGSGQGPESAHLRVRPRGHCINGGKWASQRPTRGLISVRLALCLRFRCHRKGTLASPTAAIEFSVRLALRPRPDHPPDHPKAYAETTMTSPTSNERVGFRKARLDDSGTIGRGWGLIPLPVALSKSRGTRKLYPCVTPLATTDAVSKRGQREHLGGGQRFGLPLPPPQHHCGGARHYRLGHSHHRRSAFITLDWEKISGGYQRGTWLLLNGRPTARSRYPSECVRDNLSQHVARSYVL